jgi:hypothetical protein
MLRVWFSICCLGTFLHCHSAMGVVVQRANAVPDEVFVRFVDLVCHTTQAKAWYIAQIKPAKSRCDTCNEQFFVEYATYTFSLYNYTLQS